MSGRRFPFPPSFSPAPPHPPLPSLPCATAQGWNLTHLDNARKFNLKFTVAEPYYSPAAFHQIYIFCMAEPESDMAMARRISMSNPDRERPAARKHPRRAVSAICCQPVAGSLTDKPGNLDHCRSRARQSRHGRSDSLLISTM